MRDTNIKRDAAVRGRCATLSERAKHSSGPTPFYQGPERRWKFRCLIPITALLLASAGAVMRDVGVGIALAPVGAFYGLLMAVGAYVARDMSARSPARGWAGALLVAVSLVGVSSCSAKYGSLSGDSAYDHDYRGMPVDR